MPSKNMLPKGQRRRTVKHEYRATRGVEETTPPPIPVLDVDFDDDAEDHIHTFTADPAAANLRLDQYLAQAIPDISRARVQLLIESGQVRVEDDSVLPRHLQDGPAGNAASGTAELRHGGDLRGRGRGELAALHDALHRDGRHVPDVRGRDVHAG